MRIMRALIAEIADGALRPGDRLMESRIAAKFGVSRAPSRQALAELEALGFIIHAEAPARGYAVAIDAAKRAARYDGTPVQPFRSKTTPTWQFIYGEVEDAVTRRLAFGSWRLIETTLAKHYGVSRTVARDVLARLQSSGLVVNEGKGWIAPELSQKRVRDLYELRALIEPAALSDIASDFPASDLDNMLNDLRDAVHGKADGPTLNKLEADLHFDVLRRCRNTALRKAMIEAQSLLLAHKFFYQHTADIYPVEPFLAEHIDVLETLQKGAVSEACTGLRDHLINSSNRAVERIAKIRDQINDTPPDFLEQMGPKP